MFGTNSEQRKKIKKRRFFRFHITKLKMVDIIKPEHAVSLLYTENNKKNEN